VHALALVLVCFLAADIRLIGLDDLVGPAERAGRHIVRRLAQAMEQEPCCLVIRGDHPLQLKRAKAFLAGRHQLRGQNPFRQRDMRAFHHGSNRDAERLAAILALVDARPGALAL
jgi:hypothetical protein